jgi:hypothetical protein
MVTLPAISSWGFERRCSACRSSLLGRAPGRNILLARLTTYVETGQAEVVGTRQGEHARSGGAPVAMSSAF